MMEGDRLLKGGDTVTDDLLHLVADHIKEVDCYDFTDGPVRLPPRRYWMPCRTNYQNLKNWLERKRATSVQDLIHTARYWKKDGHRDRRVWGGYINSEVWEKLQDKVDLDSIQPEEMHSKIRLLTGPDEVTNSLMDTVVRYIDEPLRFHFAIEQLGLTWKNVSRVYPYPDAEEVLQIWYWDRCIGGITTETFLKKVTKWEHAGFISADVWSKLDDIVDSETIKIGLSASIEDECEKLCEDDKVTERVLSCVSRHIVSSRLPEFAMEILRLKYHQYREARSILKKNEMLSDLKVLMCWYKLQPEGITVKEFLQMLKKWEAAGFMASDVWSNLNDMIDSHTIESAVHIFSQDNKDHNKLSLEDYPDGRVLGCVARYVFDSRTLHFAVDMLGLPARTYSQIEEDCKDEKHLMNLMLLLEWRNHHEEISVNKLVNRLSNWVQQGYLHENVWTDISEFVSHEAIASALSNDCSTTSTHNEESVLEQNLQDRMLSHVSQYVYPSELKEFAVKRLGFRETEYEMIEEDHIYAKRRNFEVLVSWLGDINSWELKFFISNVLQWQQAGYISKDVWDEMDKIVSPDLLPSQKGTDKSVLEFDSSEQVVKEAYDSNKSDEHRKFSSIDNIDDYFWIVISLYIYPSKRKGFALQALRLKESEYNRINNETKGAVQKNEQIMSTWYFKNDHITVKNFMGHVASWVESGFVSPDVWLDLKRYVRSDVLRPYIQAASDTKKREKEANDWFSQLQRRTKRSIRIRCWSALSTEWMPEDKAKTFPLQDYPVQFELISNRNNRTSTQHLSFRRIENIFCLQEEEQYSKVLLKGVAAMGKTYTLAAFANEWAQEGTENETDATQSAKIKSFDLVFLLRLRNVTSNTPLESIIAEQHELFKEQESQLKKILEGSIKYRVLLCFDGYDEYTPGTNEAVDQAISSPSKNYSILLTTRPGLHVSRRVSDQMNCQVHLEGFTDEEIKKCTEDYLDEPDEAQKFINNLKNTGLKDLKKIPAFLLMMLQLHGKLESLLKKKTEVIWNITRMVIDRSVRRHFSKTVDEVEKLEEMLYALGELSWNVLQKSTKSLVVNKSDIEHIDPNILKLGLLQGALYDETSTDVLDLPEFLSYPIKLFHEFLSGYYASKQKQKSWRDFFPSWGHITKYGQVVLSACGLAFDPLPLLQHIHRMFVHWKTRVMATESDVDIQPEEELFASLARETGVCLVPSLQQLSLCNNEELQKSAPEPKHSFQMTATTTCTEFAVALINGESATLQDLQSEVSVDVPSGIKATLWQKVHTEFSRFLHIVPDDECFAGPVVEMHLKPLMKKEIGQHQYRIKIPHCLKSTEGRLSIKVRNGDLRRKIPFKELKHKKETSGQIPCFEVDEHYVIIYTNHFTDHICSTCKETCFSYIMTFPFGSIHREEDDDDTQATVEVYLCCYLFNLEDFKANLERKLWNRRTPLHLLTEINVPIRCDQFIPESSEVAVTLKVTDGHPWQPENPDDDRWNSTEKSFSKAQNLRLKSVMDVDKCHHLCKIDTYHYPREAGSFQLRIPELRKSFRGFLQVTLFAPDPKGTKTGMGEKGVTIRGESRFSGTMESTYETGTLKDKILSDESLTYLTSKIAARDLTTIAIGYMGFTKVQTTNLKDECHNDLGLYSREILIRWKKRNSSDPDISLKFAEVLRHAVNDGYIDNCDVQQFWSMCRSKRSLENRVPLTANLEGLKMTILGAIFINSFCFALLGIFLFYYFS